jgi:hypothetical protein
MKSLSQTNGNPLPFLSYRSYKSESHPNFEKMHFLNPKLGLPVEYQSVIPIPCTLIMNIDSHSLTLARICFIPLDISILFHLSVDHRPPPFKTF